MKRVEASSGEACVKKEERENSKTWSYIWLAYSGFYFIEPVLRRDSRYWLETACVYAVFLALYIGIARTSSRRIQSLLVGALLLLGVLNYPRNSGASSFFIYAAGVVPFLVEETIWTLGLVVADAMLLLAEGWWLSGHHPRDVSRLINLAISVFFTLVVGASNLVVAQQRRADRKLRRAEREIVELAAVAERERIARDLHDVLGHTLSVIVLKAELAGRLVERDPGRATAEIGDVERTARTALAEVREAIGGYRGHGLTAEMVLARRALDAAGVVLTLEEIDAAPAGKLDTEAQTVLSLTLREAVTNIVRHAHATHCRVSFTTKGGEHALLIEDDGTHPAPREGNGLRGMRERVQRMGGRFSLETGWALDKGTRVRVEIPVAAAR